MSELAVRVGYEMLERQLSQFRDAIRGIPDEDLNTWKPAAEQHIEGEMNTFAVLAVHIVGAGTWRLYQQVYGDRVDRDRDGEFRATASARDIDDMFDDWLDGFRQRMDRDVQPDLASFPDTPRPDHPDWTRLHWLISMIDHTALHVGHAQIHRQLWEAERNEN